MRKIDVYLADISRVSSPDLLLMKYRAQVKINADPRFERMSDLGALTRGIVGELLCRKVLSRMLGVPLGMLKFSKTDTGKPYLEDYPNLYFNLSHSKDMVACAVGDAPLGVDIEKIGKVRRKAAQKCFSENEISALNNADNPNQMFYKLWTMKEAYVKAEGFGFTVPPKSADVLSLTEHSISTALIGTNYCLSICARGDFTAVFHPPKNTTPL